MTACTLVVLTDGRRDCIARSIPAALANLHGLDLTVLISDDSGDPEYRSWLADQHIAHGTSLMVHGDHRTGYASAVRRAWAAAVELGTPWVFWLEDDFVLREPIDLTAMATVLEARPHLTQMVLKRQPWFGNEIAAGSMITDPASVTEHRDEADHRWMEHTLGHWSNPHLVHHDFLATHTWPMGEWSEARFGQQVLVDGRMAGMWGHLADLPAVEHIGKERIGVGY